MITEIAENQIFFDINVLNWVEEIKKSFGQSNISFEENLKSNQVS